jgi:cytochrome c-type biogenesis protein CcmH/NrfF
MYNAEFGNDWLKLENHAERRAKLWAIAIAVLAMLVAGVVWLMMRRRHQRQARINAELSARIKELSEKYDVLS